MSNRFVKIGADGAQLPTDAPEWPAVLDTENHLMWSSVVLEADSWSQADEFAKKVDVGGFSDWRMPTRKELLTLVDDTRCRPAIDTAFFPNCPTDDWYWTSTPAAPSPRGCAWFVSFLSGYAYWYYRNFSGFVRAVRASQ